MKAALEDQGGSRSRRTVFRRRPDKKWGKLLDSVERHEQLESTEAAAHRSAQFMRPKPRKKLLTSLDKVDTAITEWRTDATNKRTYEDTSNNDEAHQQARMREGLTRMLIPRVRLERSDVESGRFIQAKDLSDNSLAWSKQGAVGGGINSLDLVQHQHGQQNEVGFFKQDQVMGADGGYVEANVANMTGGVDEKVGNWGARSVAMSRLDQALGTGIMATTEFSTHSGHVVADRDPNDETIGPKFDRRANMIGTHQAAAGGHAMADLINANEIRPIGDRARDGRPSLSDPNLQRLLSILQVVDAIAGQLDRHAGNYFVQTDENGRVTGVTGIDLDQAFTENHHGVQAGAENWARNPVMVDQSHFKGVPALVDREFAERLIRVPDDTIRWALEPLLSPAELDATMGRWMQVRARLRMMQRNNELVDTWNDETARRQHDETTSYLGMARTMMLKRAVEAVPPESVAAHLHPGEWKHFVTDRVLDASQSLPDLSPPQATAVVARVGQALNEDERYLEAYLRYQAALAPLVADFEQKDQTYREARGDGLASDVPDHIAAPRAAAEKARNELSVQFDDVQRDWVTTMVATYLRLIENGHLGPLPAPAPPQALPDDVFPPLRVDSRRSSSRRRSW